MRLFRELVPAGVQAVSVGAPRHRLLRSLRDAKSQGSLMVFLVPRTCNAVEDLLKDKNTDNPTSSY